MTDTNKETTNTVAVFVQILEEHITAAQHERVKTSDELMSMILDIQDHDGKGFDETVATLLIMGAEARKRSIASSAATKLAKDRSARLDRYNAWCSKNPDKALNPVVNLTTQFAYGLIDKAQYELMLKALNGAQASIETHTVALADQKAS